MKTITQEQVDAALDTAVKENGYTELATWTDVNVASDLIDVNAAFEDCTIEQLRPFVWSWQQRNGGRLVEIKWPTGPHTGALMYVPQAAMRNVESSYLTRLEEKLGQETVRANELGCHLIVAVKALEGMRGVMVAVQKLRRFDGDKNSNNPLEVYAKGYLAMQDGKELDDAVKAAAEAMEHLEEAMEHLEKEYPNDTSVRF